MDERPPSEIRQKRGSDAMKITADALSKRQYTALFASIMNPYSGSYLGYVCDKLFPIRIHLCWLHEDVEPVSRATTQAAWGKEETAGSWQFKSLPSQKDRYV